MEKFPKINIGQVVLLRCTVLHGHVLDESFKLAISSTQKVFTVFDNLQDAINYANEILKKTTEYEFNIYNERNIHINRLSAYETRKDEI